MQCQLSQLKVTTDTTSSSAAARSSTAPALAPYKADVGISAGRIARIGRITEAGREEIDATGNVVTPGFIDGHTHMDAQVFWDPLGTSSCWHGVTTVVMGHCGFTLAPASFEQRHLVIRNLERAEDISGAAMAAGIDWSWTTFAEYLDAVDRLPKALNYAANIGHSALRTYAMGERAFTEEAGASDLAAMRAELRDALRAGAYGLTTSRTLHHETSDDRPVASRLAELGRGRARSSACSASWAPASSSSWRTRRMPRSARCAISASSTLP